MLKPKQYLLLFFFCFLYVFSNAQNINWMLGTWKGVGNSRKAQFVRTLEITSVNGNNFSGTRSKEAHDHTNSKIITSVLGRMSKDTFYMKDGAILFKKDPPKAQWLDCTHCIPTNRVVITYDSVFLSSEVIGCADYCDGTSVYYKLMPDLDTATQRSLVDNFGTPEQIASFKPLLKSEPEVASSDPDQVKPKINQDSINNAAKLAKKKQQQIDDSLKLTAALEKKRQQHILDSLSIVKKEAQQHIQDSLNNAATIAKKRQQEVDDSTANANNLVKKRQQQIDDSLKAVAAIEKKKQEHIQDSLSLAEQQNEQRKQDSLTNAAVALKKMRQHILDSTNTANALAKKRLQQIDDSLKLAAVLEKKRQQHIQDSISIAKQLQQQHIQDSLTNAAVALKKRQKEIQDSTTLADAIAKKRQQQINDSLNNVALMAKKKQQQLQDSLNKTTAAFKIREQQTQDSIRIAAAKPLPDTTKLTGAAKIAADKNKKLTQRANVLLQTYHINTPDILIELFDNAEIDGDRVSVFHNNQIIVNNQTLSHEPITYKVHADSANRTHEFVLIAENLGTIPPNTALMRITVGSQVYKLSVKTDLKTNAKIDFFYDGN